MVMLYDNSMSTNTFLNEVIIKKIVAVQNVSSLLQEESKFFLISSQKSFHLSFLKAQCQSDAAFTFVY